MAVHIKRMISTVGPWAFVLLAAGACVLPAPKNQIRIETYNLANILSSPDQLQKISKRIEQGREIIIRIDRGQVLPAKIQLDMPLAEMIKSQDSVRLRFTHSLFLLFSKSGVRASLEGQTWKNADNLAELKHLFGIDKATFGINLLKQNQGDVTLVLKVKMY